MYASSYHIELDAFGGDVDMTRVYA